MAEDEPLEENCAAEDSLPKCEPAVIIKLGSVTLGDWLRVKFIEREYSASVAQKVYGNFVYLEIFEAPRRASVQVAPS